MAEAATPARDRFSRQEIRFVPTVDIAKIQKEADRVSKSYRELDTQIQAKNWEIELAA